MTGDAVALVAGGLLCLAAALWVVRPLWRGAPTREPVDPRAVALLAEREALLATLRDLDADARAERLGADDHARLRAESVDRAARVLTALDVLAAENAGRTAEIVAAIEREVAQLRDLATPAGAHAPAVDAAGGVRCAACGRQCPGGDQFCARCGHALADAATA
jgi:hypothetical protein